MLAGTGVGIRTGGRCAWPPVGGAIGASSGTRIVGATRAGSSRAPQPPQNRESGAFSVPQLGQRIPGRIVTQGRARAYLRADPTSALCYPRRWR